MGILHFLNIIWNSTKTSTKVPGRPKGNYLQDISIRYTLLLYYNLIWDMGFALNQSKHIGIGLKFFSVVCVRTMMTLDMQVQDFNLCLLYLRQSWCWDFKNWSIDSRGRVIYWWTVPLNTGVIVSIPTQC